MAGLKSNIEANGDKSIDGSNQTVAGLKCTREKSLLSRLLPSSNQTVAGLKSLPWLITSLFAGTFKSDRGGIEIISWLSSLCPQPIVQIRPWRDWNVYSRVIQSQRGKFKSDRGGIEMIPLLDHEMSMIFVQIRPWRDWNIGDNYHDNKQTTG